MWIEIEIICILIETAYFGLIMRYVTTMKPCSERQMTHGSSIYEHASSELDKSMLDEQKNINASQSLSVSDLDQGNDPKYKDLDEGVSSSELSQSYNSKELMVNFKAMIEKNIQAKDHLEFEEDFFSLTMLCYLKKNRNKYLLSHSKQAMNLHNAILVSCCQALMLLCMTNAMLDNEGGEYSMAYAGSVWVLYVKFPCAIALHFYLYPEVQKGMMIMKFANNQPD